MTLLPGYLMHLGQQFLLCEPATLEKRKICHVCLVKTVEMKDTILAVCRERSDTWADAVYHKVCRVKFHTKKHIPAVNSHQISISKRTLIWVVHNTKKMHAFLEDASFLKDNDDKKITINDLISRMEENLENSEHGIVTRTCN